MLRLYILRHVNTAWALPGQRDFDRALNEEGVEDLAVIRNWIKEQNFSPQHVYCSSAVRTRSTFDGIQSAMESKPSVDYLDRLYSGNIADYMSALTEHDENTDVMIIGHNPNCASLLGYLISQTDQGMAHSFPAGALAAIDFDIEAWSELKPNGGKLAEFLIPRSSQRYEA